MRRRILFLTTYPSSDASTRRRVCAVMEILGRRGYAVRMDSIVSPWLYKNKNRTGLTIGAWKLAHLLHGLLRRVLFVAIFRMDVVVIHREAFPFFTPVLERAVRRRCHTLILDVDDAIHLSPPKGRDWRTPLRRPEAFLQVVQDADIVIAASQELCRVYGRHNKKVFLALTSPDPHPQLPRAPERLIV